MKKADCVYIGYISRTRGLKGEVQLFFEYPDYQELDFDVLFLEFDGKLVPYFVDTYKMHNNSTAYLFFEDIDHIDKATPLLRKQVYLQKDKLPVRDEDDFSILDLEGFFVIDEEYGDLGVIENIHEYPQQFVAALTLNEKEILFPLNEDMISFIDVEKKSITVTLPEGLIDLYLG
jgi:16S rRNA processing protein RimM